VAVLGAQVTLTPEQSSGRLTECHLGPVHYFWGPPVQYPSSAGLVGGAQTQPMGEVLFGGELIQIHSHFSDHALGYLYIHAIDPRPVHSRDPQIEFRNIPARTFCVLGGGLMFGYATPVCNRP
jgi:hypothetical protein